MINLKAPEVRIEIVSHRHPDLSMSRPGYNTFPAETDYNDRFCKKLEKKRIKKYWKFWNKLLKARRPLCGFGNFRGKIDFFEIFEHFRNDEKFWKIALHFLYFL